MDMKERIVKSWETTAIGIVIIAAAVIMVVLDKATIYEAGIFIGIGAGLFFTKNKKT